MAVVVLPYSSLLQPPVRHRKNSSHPVRPHTRTEGREEET